MQVLTKLTAAGLSTGPFNLTSNVGLVIPSTATRDELLAGIVATISDMSTEITITSIGTCINYITLPIAGIPSPTVTPTPTITRTPSITPSKEIIVSLTPTPTISITPSITPTISITPSITPTKTVTPSPTISPNSSPLARTIFYISNGFIEHTSLCNPPFQIISSPIYIPGVYEGIYQILGQTAFSNDSLSSFVPSGFTYGVSMNSGDLTDPFDTFKYITIGENGYIADVGVIDTNCNKIPY
jgi:hypothetical protein